MLLEAPRVAATVPLRACTRDYDLVLIRFRRFVRRQEVQKQQSDYQERKRKAERIRRERQQQQHGRNDEVLTNPAPFP